jgi:hypothetical protein
MKNIVAFIAAVLLSGCLHFTHKPTDNYAHMSAVILPAFSQTVTAYYGNKHVPRDFDKDEYLKILKENQHTNKKDIEVIKSYIKEAHYLDDKNFSVMLCDPGKGNKIMEDLSCDLSKTEIKTWKQGDNYPCQFEIHWENFCNQP